MNFFSVFLFIVQLKSATVVWLLAHTEHSSRGKMGGDSFEIEIKRESTTQRDYTRWQDGWGLI